MDNQCNGEVAHRKPSIGRIVHWVDEGSGEHKPAIITRVHGGTCVNVTIFQDSNSITRSSVCFDGDADPRKGTWHWPRD